MAEIKWVTPIRVEKGVRKGERLIRNPRDTELDWLFYSGIQGIRSRPTRHVWDMHRTTTKTGAPYEPSLKQSKKTKRDHITYLPQKNWKPLTVNRMAGYPFNIALTINLVKERGPSRKTSVRLYPTESCFDLFGIRARIKENMVLVPYDKCQKKMEAQSVKTSIAPKPMKKKKDHMSYLPSGERDTSTHRKSEASIDWISF